MAENNGKLLRDYGGTVLIAILVALFIRIFVIEAYRIPSPAMRPTLEPGDTIFVSKWDYGFHVPWQTDPVTSGRLPGRGEIVVFASPSEPKREYIKRVIGLPGDLVQVKKGFVFLNGTALDPKESSSRDTPCLRETLPEGLNYNVCREHPPIEDFGPEKVPPGSVFVIGDLRSQAQGDTRKRTGWGIVPISSIRGRARWIWLSIEPHHMDSVGRFPQFRFDRMFTRIL